MEAEGGTLAFVAPGRLERHDHLVLEIFRDLTDVVAHIARNMFNHHRSVRFPTKGQERLPDAPTKSCFDPYQLFGDGGFWGGFLRGLHDKAELALKGFIGRLRRREKEVLMHAAV